MKMINLKLGFRTLYRNKQYTVLNMLGLSIGMASAMLIFLWVQFQVSFDRFHANGDNIYRVIQDQFYTNGEVFHVQVTPSGMAKALKENIANIELTTHYSREQALVQVNETKIMEQVYFVDPEFFSMFSFPLVKGDTSTIFKNTHSIVISEKMARKYFGDKDPVGEIMVLDATHPFTVTGIIQDPPKNTELDYGLLIPFEFYKELGRDINDMGNNWLMTYVQLTPGTTAELVNQNIEKYKKQHFPDAEAVFYLQPLRNIHLYWIWGGGPIKNVRLFSIIAVLLIIVAAINFTNLSTAMAATRYKEIGVKKTFGADRRVLVVQFLSETMLLSVISFFIALILAETFLPWYNKLLGTELGIHYNDGILIAGFLGIMLLTGFLSGVYPALFLSSFKPIKILKSNGSLHKRSILRETLVVLQFCLAIVLIVNTIIIKKQQDFMRKKDVGIQRENILYMPMRGELKSKYELFKSQLLADPDIKNVSSASHLPTGIYSNGGGYNWQGKPPEVDPLVSRTTVDCDYLKTYGIKIHEGEFYPENTYKDTLHIVINKTFADIIDIQPIIGTVIERSGSKMSVIGVTEDFNFKPLSAKVEPLAMVCFSDYNQYISCRISSNDIQKTIKKIEKLYEEINGNYPFEYHFLDADYDSMYASETRQGKIFNIFSFLAILISCLGLFGLSSFMMAQRIKEIGVRKANGATVTNIVMLFSRYYIRWVIISFAIAVPVSYFIIRSWLKGYAYKTPISWWIFVAAGSIAILIALVTVSWQSWKAASQNPVDALKYE